jgi:hypothetical protein
MAECNFARVRLCKIYGQSLAKEFVSGFAAQLFLNLSNVCASPDSVKTISSADKDEPMRNF